MPKNTPDLPTHRKVMSSDDFGKSDIYEHILGYYELQNVPTLVKLQLFKGCRTV